MNLRKKILKVLIFLSILTLLISTTLIPASADNVPYDVYRITKTDGTNVDYTPSGYGYNGVNSLFYELNSPQKSCYLYINIPDIFVAGSVVTISYTVIIPNTIKEFSFFFGGQQFVPQLSNFSGDGSSYTVSASFTKTFNQYTEGVTLYIAYVDQTSSTVGPFGIQRIHLENSKDEAAIQQGQTDQIKENQDKNTDKIIDEDFGYKKPSTSKTDDGLDSAGNLIDSLNDSIDDFNKNLDTSVDKILTSIQPFKIFVHDLFDVFPSVVQYLITFAVVFLVLRKVVGR